MDKKNIDSMHKYIEICLEKPHLQIYRGQENTNWELKPGINRESFTRNLLNADEKTILEAEKHIFKLFKARAMRYMGNHASGEIEKLAIAQHYGLPTRLLDWTTSPLVALFFAVESENDGVDGCVYVSKRLTEAPSTLKPFEVDQNYLVIPPHVDERIPAQHGVFLLSENPFKPYQNENMTKIEIASIAKRELKHQLHRLGINASTIYPGLNGVAKSIAALQWQKP